MSVLSRSSLQTRKVTEVSSGNVSRNPSINYELSMETGSGLSHVVSISVLVKMDDGAMMAVSGLLFNYSMCTFSTKYSETLFGEVSKRLQKMGGIASCGLVSVPGNPFSTPSTFCQTQHCMKLLILQHDMSTMAEHRGRNRILSNLCLLTVVLLGLCICSVLSDRQFSNPLNCQHG